jgi:hypothetical protein
MKVKIARKKYLALLFWRKKLYSLVEEIVFLETDQPGPKQRALKVSRKNEWKRHNFCLCRLSPKEQGPGRI